MWKVPEESLKAALPPGFSLIEDGDFVHLFCGEKKIASFYFTVALPVILKSVAEAYKSQIMPQK